jgi:hypothetical protein
MLQTPFIIFLCSSIFKYNYPFYINLRVNIFEIDEKGGTLPTLPDHLVLHIPHTPPNTMANTW